MSVRAARIAAQVAHIGEHTEAFRDHTGDADVAGYFADYCTAYCWDLYERLCSDLGIAPKPELASVNPEDC